MASQQSQSSTDSQTPPPDSAGLLQELEIRSLNTHLPGILLAIFTGSLLLFWFSAVQHHPALAHIRTDPARHQSLAGAIFRTVSHSSEAHVWANIRSLLLPLVIITFFTQTKRTISYVAVLMVINIIANTFVFIYYIGFSMVIYALNIIAILIILDNIRGIAASRDNYPLLAPILLLALVTFSLDFLVKVVLEFLFFWGVLSADFFTFPYTLVFDPTTTTGYTRKSALFHLSGVIFGLCTCVVASTDRLSIVLAVQR